MLDFSFKVSLLRHLGGSRVLLKVGKAPLQV